MINFIIVIRSVFSMPICRNLEICLNLRRIQLSSESHGRIDHSWHLTPLLLNLIFADTTLSLETGSCVECAGDLNPWVAARAALLAPLTCARAEFWLHWSYWLSKRRIYCYRFKDCIILLKRAICEFFNLTCELLIINIIIINWMPSLYVVFLPILQKFLITYSLPVSWYISHSSKVKFHNTITLYL